ncbi:MAG: hypothetical protein JWP30_498 [Homoserinimonas sp.]|jgi:uncharacterized membrane protein|nr:hypothetical protein [Homoserinimonas sp.]
MARAIAVMLGFLLGGHGVIGLFIEGEHLLHVMNVDIVIDVLYIVTAVALLTAASFRNAASALRVTLLAVGAVLIVLAVLAMIDNSVMGLLPTGLTLLDFVYLFGVGGVAVVVAITPGSTKPLITGDTRVL